MRPITNVLVYCIWFTFSLIITAQTLPTQTSTLFSGSGNCALCHQPGLPNTAALLDPDGQDISPVSLWRSSIMANAAKDPFWQAKVTAEVAAHPFLQAVIEDKCTTCHAPLGRTEAVFNGAPGYSLTEMQNDSLALDGVSCTLCHQIKPDNFGGGSYSGHYLVENDRLIYGPYQNPFTMPMQLTVNYTPTFGEQMQSAAHCATCHTLFTPTVDNSGQIVGELPEQTPYLEWRNSRFSAEGRICQDCHMPPIDDEVIISNRPIWLGARTPFWRHYFVGGDVFMLTLLRDNAAAIGVTATAEHFDSTLARTRRFLRNQTAGLAADAEWLLQDTLAIKVAVTNRTGHKLPTGYPSRRMWLHLRIEDGSGQPVFESGSWDPVSGEIAGLDSPYEPHHQVIRTAGQVQVYQALMGDVDGNLTYTLLRGATYLKDNRLPPKGFTTQGPFYDSTRVEGMAAQDPDFNRSAGQEGSGSDTVFYHIGGLAPGESYRVDIRLRYQSLAPRFAADLLQYNTPEVAAFAGYYQDADKSPALLDSLTFSTQATALPGPALPAPQSPLLLQAYPNPFNPRAVIALETAAPGKVTIIISDLLGRTVRRYPEQPLAPGRQQFYWEARDDQNQAVAAGLYIINVRFAPLAGGPAFFRSEKIVYLK